MITTQGSVSVTHHDDNGTWLIALAGEHDIATTPLLDERTRSVWPHCSVAVIDLSAATFIDCSVVGWLVRTRVAFDTNPNEGRAVRIVQGLAGSGVQRVFELLRLHEEFPCYRTSHDALTGRRSPDRPPPRPPPPPDRADAPAANLRPRAGSQPTG